MELVTKYEETLLKAKNILDSVPEGASLSDEQREEVQAFVEEANGYEKKLKAAHEDQKLRKAVDGLRPTDVTPDETLSGSVGERFVKSAQYQAQAKTGFGGRFNMGAVDLGIGIKDVTLGGSPIAEDQRLGGIVDIALRRPVVADLMPSGQVSGGSITYAQETAVTDNTAVVAEGATKPESTITLAVVTEALSKIATLLDVSDEMLADVQQIRSYLDSRLALFVKLEEEDQLVNGSGVGANLLGLMNRAGLQTNIDAVTAAGAIEAIYNQITAIRANAFLEPDGIVVHPTDWAQIRLQKDANNQYFGGGPFTGAYGNNGIASDSLWGLRAVVTPAMTLNTILVGAFAAGAQVWRKGGITVDASSEHASNFASNLVTLRAEERLALAVYRPAAFGKVINV